MSSLTVLKTRSPTRISTAKTKILSGLNSFLEILGGGVYFLSIWVVSRIQFFVVVGLRFLFSCWLYVEGFTKLLEATIFLGSWPFLYLQSQLQIKSLPCCSICSPPLLRTLLITLGPTWIIQNNLPHLNVCNFNYICNVPFAMWSNIHRPQALRHEYSGGRQHSATYHMGVGFQQGRKVGSRQPSLARHEQARRQTPSRKQPFRLHGGLGYTHQHSFTHRVKECKRSLEIHFFTSSWRACQLSKSLGFVR